MKNKYIILFCLINLCVFAQKEEDKFFSVFKEITPTFLFDKLEYDNIISKLENRISFAEFEKKTFFLDDNRKALIVEDTIKISLYPICKFKLDNFYCLSVLNYNKEKNNEYSEIIMLFYNFENKLLNTNTVFLPVNIEEYEKTSVLFNNKEIFVNRTDNTYLTLNKSFPQFYSKISDKDSIINISKIQYEYLPERKEKKEIIFNKEFYNSANFINIFFVENFINSNIIMGVNKKEPKKIESYFINSYELVNDKKIVFFKTDYEFEDYNIYSIIGYDILLKDNKHGKNNIISSYVVPKNDDEWLHEGSLKIENNKLIISSFDGYDKSIEEFILKK